MRRLHTLLLSPLLLVGCFDPVHSERVDALGPEAPGVSPGPFHRPGQPCTVCHGGSGPGSPTFDLAGTVFAFEGERVPADGATVRLIDRAGNTQRAGTNQAGNFWVSESDLVLRFPIWVSVDFGGASVDMKTPIFRARSCAECHGDAAGPSSVGRVFAVEESP